MDYIGHRLKKVRKLKGISQQQLASLLGISKATVSKIESGQQEPGSKILHSILKILSIDINWLLTGYGNILVSENEELTAMTGTHGPNLRLIRNQKALSVLELSKIINLPEQDIIDIESNKKPLTEEICEKIASKLNFSIDFFACNDGSRHKITTYECDNNDIILLPFYANICDNNSIDRYYPFSSGVFKSINVDPKTCFIIKAVGNAMYPTISDGDHILINSSCKEIIDSKIYLLKSNNTQCIRKLQILPKNNLKLISKNKDFDDYIINYNDDEFEIVGQIISCLKNLV